MSILTWVLVIGQPYIKILAGKSHVWSFFGQKWAIFGDFWVFRGLQKIFHGKIHELMIDCSCTKYPYMDFT